MPPPRLDKGVRLIGRPAGPERSRRLRAVRRGGSMILGFGAAAPEARRAKPYRIDRHRAQTFGEPPPGERLPGSALDRYDAASHGRPPSRFFSQSWPVL